MYCEICKKEFKDKIVKSYNEDQIMRALIVGEFQNKLMKGNLYEWTTDELSEIRNAITKCGLNITKEKRLDDDEEQGNLRVDWAFVTDNDDCNVVWVNKMDNSKSFGYNNGIYNLLGVGLNFPNTNCMTIKDLSQKLSDYINMLIR